MSLEIKTREEFRAWVMSALRDCECATLLDVFFRSGLRTLLSEKQQGKVIDGTNSFMIYYDTDHGTTLIVNTRNGRHGFAKCGHSQFSYYVGAAVAWRKYCGVEIPIFDAAWTATLE